MKLSKEQFIEQYIYYFTEMQKASLKDDNMSNNRYAKKLYRLKKENENEKYFIDALKELMNNESIEISSIAAVDCLRYSCNIENALKVLKEISNRQDSGIVGIKTGMVLKIWKEKGAEGIK